MRCPGSSEQVLMRCFIAVWGCLQRCLLPISSQSSTGSGNNRWPASAKDVLGRNWLGYNLACSALLLVQIKLRTCSTCAVPMRRSMGFSRNMIPRKADALGHAEREGKQLQQASGAEGTETGPAFLCRAREPKSCWDTVCGGSVRSDIH